jgi:carboxyl-terminal processing protease
VKIMKRKTRVLGVMLPVVLAFAAGVLVGGGRAGAASEDRSPYSAVGQLGRVLVLVENEYVDPVERGRLVEGAIKGMVTELDPHSEYLRADEWKAFHGDTEGKFGGIGVEVDGRNGQLTVIAPIEGSPADRAGILSGDRIVGVDGEDARHASLDKLVKQMRGEPGTRVKITVVRGGTETRVFDLVREVIHLAAVTAKALDGGAIYLRIRQFQEGTHAELVSAVGKARRDAGGRVQGVILDLRSNPGGLVDEAAEVTDEFLSSGTIYTMRHRGETVEEAKAHAGGALVDMPLVVLVDEWSASASELVTGALQDHKRGVVVGAPTFGKGSVQSILDLPGGAGLKLTTARYFTPSGHAIQADGIHPDVIVEKENAGRAAFRERDLGNHLSAEGPQGGVPAISAHDAGVVRTDVDGGDEPVQATRDVPKDPSKSADFVLALGYKLLRQRMAGK